MMHETMNVTINIAIRKLIEPSSIVGANTKGPAKIKISAKIAAVS